MATTTAIALDPRLKEYMAQGYAKVGAISFKICDNLTKGKDHVRSQQELWNRGIRMVRLLKVLYRHVYFDDSGNVTLYRITSSEVNRILNNLVEVGQLDLYPIVPSVLPSIKPRTITDGQQGKPGLNGLPGNDANIIVRPANDEDQIVVDTLVEGGVKVFELSFLQYIEQLLSVTINSGTSFEIGTVQDFDITLLSTKGTREIQTLICTSNPIIDAILQPLVNLPALNGVSQPVTILVPTTGQTSNETFVFDLYDGKNHRVSSISMNFYYPYLFGTSDTTTGFNYYTTLNKTIAPKGNRNFILNDTDKYFWIGFDASYGTLSSIKDQNGYEKLGDWVEVDDNVTSSGLVNNYSNIPYKFYRTILKTSIVNFPYTITFSS